MRRSSVLALGFILYLTLLANASGSAVIPSGTQVRVRFSTGLSSKNATVGQVFHGSLESPLAVRGRVVYPKGSRVTGRVTAVHPSGRLSDPGVLEVTLTSVSTGRSSSRLNTQRIRIKGESHTKSNIEKIGGTAAAGAILGAIIGGGKGAAVGAGVGAATGTGVAAATGHKEANIESEAVLVFVTTDSSTPAAQSQPAPVQVEPQPSYDEQRPYQDDRVYRSRREHEDDDREYDEEHDRPYRVDDGDRDDDRGYGQSHYSIIFSETDRRIIRSCYREDYSNLPPGLAKKDRLPPGLERHLQRNGTLPPGLQKRVQPLPQYCESQLPPIRRGWARMVISGRVMLLDPNNRIVDLFFLRD